MRANEFILEGPIDPVKLASRAGKRYGTEKDYGYFQSETVPGQYIPLRRFNADFVDELEDDLYKTCKVMGWDKKSMGYMAVGKYIMELVDKYGTIETMDINSLYPSQPFVRIEDLELLKQKINSNKEVEVKKHNGRNIITDGHHAALAARLRGEKQVTVKFLDLDNVMLQLGVK